MTKSSLTAHARKRCQQRAVPTLIASMLLDYGTCMRHEGADVHYFDKAARKRIQKAVGGGRNFEVIERWLDTYTVVEDGQVVTVARRTKRLKRP